MKDAKQSAKARIKQLERQRLNWFEENSDDQGDYVKILAAIESKQAEAEVIQKEIELLNAQRIAKQVEMVGENKVQIEKFDQLIKEATETYEDL